MEITLQHFEECPNWRVAEERLRGVLAETRRADVDVRLHAVATPNEAEAAGFRGSPTILIDGRDPFADPDAPVGLACRVYRTDRGAEGAPSVEQLRTALRDA